MPFPTAGGDRWASHKKMIAAIRDALAAAFTDGEVRKYFRLEPWQEVTEARRRRMARHKASNVLDILTQEVTDKLAVGENVSIPGFIEFQYRPAREYSGKLYPCSEGYLVGDLMQKITLTAEVSPGNYAGGPAVAGGPYEALQVKTYWPGGELENERWGVVLGTTPGMPSDENMRRLGVVNQGVWITWGAGGRVEKRGWSVVVVVQGTMVYSPVQDLTRAVRHDLVGEVLGVFESGKSWPAFEAARLKGDAYWDAVGHGAGDIDDFEFVGGSAVELVRSFPRQVWAVPTSEGFYPVQWLTAAEWWSRFGLWSSEFLAEGYQIPPIPGPVATRNKVVGRFDKSVFEMLDYR